MEVCLAILLLGTVAMAKGPVAAPDKPIRVCVLDSPPTVGLKNGVKLNDGQSLTPSAAKDNLQGMGIDMVDVLFNQILKWNFTIVYYTFAQMGFSRILYDVRVQENCDVAVQSFFISASRDLCTKACPLPDNSTVLQSDSDYEKFACCVDFSQPFYDGGWTITSKISDGSNVNYFSVFFQRDIVHIIAVAVITTFVIAHVVWLVERWGPGHVWVEEEDAVVDPNSDLASSAFSSKYLDALRDGVWFSSNVLLNGVIAPEKRIRTPLGRLIITVWVLFGIFLISFVTSIISSTLTTAQLSASQILTANDLAGRTVCLEEGFYNFFFDSNFPGIGVSKVLVPHLSDCFEELKGGSAEAVFGVRDYSIDYFSQGKGRGLLVSPTIYPQPYGMVWSQSWEYGSAVNEALLLYREDVYATTPSYRDSKRRWYAGDASQIAYGGTAKQAQKVWNWALVYTAVGLVAVYVCLQVLVYIGGRFAHDAADDEEDVAATGSGDLRTDSGHSGASLTRAKSVKAALGTFASKMTARQPSTRVTPNHSTGQIATPSFTARQMMLSSGVSEKALMMASQPSLSTMGSQMLPLPGMGMGSGSGGGAVPAVVIPSNRAQTLGSGGVLKTANGSVGGNKGNGVGGGSSGGVRSPSFMLRSAAGSASRVRIVTETSNRVEDFRQEEDGGGGKQSV
ncbi:hypothetical protein CHLRE_12g532850v5 [Chlamydomonas reinhardtii]|uniref:Uncharacterized protein n=1 Tax=Chlamydomonas reinhardtii TaxID=3055 RepID=A0A2K3D4Y6_CHLRE|nr:uncharacterized protein CHLRE_12g532850v5 [Chlamydomonas reinhardtii]PNW75589.1 hypothetical protein CHLRE_12g532850v5 [Chlamydomonas reinhardtii]